MNNKHGQLVDQVSIGRWAGEQSSSGGGISIGRSAGRYTQGKNGIAIGSYAGSKSQGTCAVAIGQNSGYDSQGAYAIAIGQYAETEDKGPANQGESAIAIGKGAGFTKQGINAIAIGKKAGFTNQPDYSIIISTSDEEIITKKKGLFVDPIRKFDDRAARLVAPLKDTIKEGNILSYNYLNDTPKATKEIVTGFPRLPGYPTDAEVLLAFTEAKKDLVPPQAPLTAEDAGSMYFDTTKKKIKVYNGTKWIALADEDDLAKLKAAGGGAGGASLGGKLGYIPGSPDGATQSADAFMTGGGAGTTAWSMAATSGNPVTVVGPDGQAVGAIPGVDFYWDDGRKIGWENGYYPVFYKDINVVSEGVPDSPDNVPGYYVTTYDNGHVTMEQKPTADWNPPLDAFNQLPIEQRRAVLDDYCNATGVWGMTSPVGTNELGRPDAFEGTPFRDYLTSKGIT